MKNYLFPFFFLFTLFSEELFASYLSMRGILVEQGMFQNMYVAISIISYSILIHDLTTGYYKNRVWQFVFILCSILMLFGLTALTTLELSHSFRGTIFHFGSVCISGAICGMHFAIKRPWKQVEKLLPYFLMYIGLIVGTFGMRTLLLSLVMESEGSSLDYQNVSYFMAEVFAFSGYYAFFSSSRESKHFKLLRWFIYGLMIFSAAIVIVSGGRGGFVLLMISALVLMLLLAPRIKRNGLSLLIVGIAGIVAFYYLASSLSIFDSTGFDRISSSLTEDDNRKVLYKMAFNSFKESPLWGHGLGSVWMEVGYYCHNMVLDLLVEGGIIGLMVVMYIYLRTAFKLWRWKKYHPIFIFVFLAMLKVIVMTMFSGYWLHTIQLWLAFGFVFIASDKNYHRILAVKN